MCRFTKTSEIIAQGSDFASAKKAFIIKLKETKPQKVTQKAMVAIINESNFEGSLRNTDELFTKAEFNEKENFTLFRNSVMRFLEL